MRIEDVAPRNGWLRRVRHINAKQVTYSWFQTGSGCWVHHTIDRHARLAWRVTERPAYDP